MTLRMTIFLALQTDRFFAFLYSITGAHPLKSASANDVHTVCGVLKRLLNELSEPLLPDGEKLARDQGMVNVVTGSLEFSAPSKISRD